jgi:hypothetical protein
MAERKSVRLEKQQLDVISDMDERDIADNESEAHRMLLNAGKREYGYRNGEYTDTALKSFTKRVRWLLTVAGLVGLAFTFAYPVPARLPSFAVLVGGVVCYGLGEVLEEYEPRVSNRLKGIFGGETV